MRYTDEKIGDYTVDGEERSVVERTFTDGTILQFFVRHYCRECDCRGYVTEEIPCDASGNDEDSPFYLPYVNSKSCRAIASSAFDIFDVIDRYRVNEYDMNMDSLG
jgi:hypothetical protein